MLFEKQDYQNQCVDNLIKILSNYDFKQNSFESLKVNIQDFYNKYTPAVMDISNQTKLDILMETGTGKTFTYLKAIHELHENYKINKFIIFVPRKAIREGVLQNIELTSDYFFQEYGKRLKKYTYDGKSSLNAIQNHYLNNSNELSVLVLTNSSIDKDNNILKAYNESLYGLKSVFDGLKKINPVIVIDEPHLLKGEEFTKVFNEFNSLYLRFGATFPKEDEHKLSNLAYCLDSISSFRQYLVKKIRVHTIINASNILKVAYTSAKEVTLLYFKDNEEYKVILSEKQDIGVATGLSDYNGIQINSITKKGVFLSNGVELKNDIDYTLHDEEITAMIRKTIELHFKKEEEFFNSGIKTLSLFFIPHVADFRGDNPKVKAIFEEEFKKQHAIILQKTTNQDYKKFLEEDIDETGALKVHEGYFSGDRGSQDDKIADGIDQILNKKETLLSFDSNLRFIFSVWALQEGWDNPNVFQICKLASTKSDTSRRQQVGRGLRICVNQEGKRLTYNYLDNDEQRFYSYNTLDMIVSGHEKNFIEEIQKEIVENSFTPTIGNIITTQDFERLGLKSNQISRLSIVLEDNKVITYDEPKDGYVINSPLLEFIKEKRDVLSFLKDEEYTSLCEKLAEAEKTPSVENGNKQKSLVKIREHNFKNFQKLWETINRKAKIVYQNIEENSLVENICKEFDAIAISPIHIKHMVQEYDSQSNEIVYKENNSLDKVVFLKQGLNKFIEDIAKEGGFPLSFILKVISKIDHDKIKNNPKQAKIELVNIIKEQIHKVLIQSVNYEFSSEVKITSLHKNSKEYKKELVFTELGRFLDDEQTPPKHYLYDKVVYDSKIEQDTILNDPEKVDDRSITVYAKLPKISIPTPYKHYNPDFAYLINSKEGKTFFLVVEAKGYTSEKDIPTDEKQKIEYGRRFFKELQKELPDITIIYKTRINKQELSDLLADLEGQNDK